MIYAFQFFSLYILTGALTFNLCLCFRHCVSGVGFGAGVPLGGQGHGHGGEGEGEGDDNSLSPEACYECKINGYPKKGRKRRSTNGTLDEALGDSQVIQAQHNNTRHLS